MKKTYQRLAKQLNKIPNGFPETKSGIELKILQKLFSLEEAKLAASLSLELQSIKTISKINNIPEPEVKSLLFGMVKKGLIELKKEEGKGFVFGLIPFVVGFYERQNAKIDKEFAELFEEYYKEAFYKVMTVEPSVHRVIPIEKSIPVNIDVMPYEKASIYLDSAKSWGVLNCICRVQKKLIGQACKHTIENCIVFSSKENAFSRTNDIRTITKSEALEILIESDKEGLVHSTNNTQQDVSYICNCCTCSCGVLQGIAKYGSLNSVASSDFFAVVNEDLCNGCERCIDRCQFDAMKMIDNICSVNTNFCFGCGLCVTSCASQAITLQQKNPEELCPPPLTEEDWRVKRAKSMKNLQE